jgi:hypothetical protein
MEDEWSQKWCRTSARCRWRSVMRWRKPCWVDLELQQQQLADRSQSSVVQNLSEVWVLTLKTTITLWVMVEAQ